MMSERIPLSKNRKKRCGKKTYFVSCGSNVDGRLGIGGNYEGCQTRLTPVAPFRKCSTNSEDAKQNSIGCHLNSSEHTSLEQHQMTDVLVMSCGRAHTLCICKTDGALYGWGSNDKGQLGLEYENYKFCEPYTDDNCEKDICFEPNIDENTNSESFFQATNIEIERHLGAQYLHNESDTINSFEQSHKSNNETELSENTRENTRENECIGINSSPWSLLKIPIATLACGYNHTLLITSKGGQIFSFGDNKFGQLGLNDTINRNKPTHVSTVHDGTNPFFVSVAGGYSHSLALTINGEVYSFGRGAEGQLGDNFSGPTSTYPQTSSCSFTEETTTYLHKRLIPHQVKNHLTNNPVALIAASTGGHGSYAVTVYDGCGWRWGALDNEIPGFGCEDSYDDISHFSLDDDKNISSVPIPLPPPLGSFSQFQRDRSSSAPTSTESTDEISHSRETRGRGRRSSSFDITSELVRNAASNATAKLVNLSSFNESPPVSPGSSQHLFPDINGTGQCNYVSNTNSVNEGDQEKNKNLTKDRIIAISAGAKHLVCVTRAGEAYAMGSPGPQLGLGPACRLQWIQSACKMLLPGDILINGVTCGEHHTLLSCTDGRILVCGDGRYGMLGLDGKDLEVASCEVDAIPKIIPISFNFDSKSCSTTQQFDVVTNDDAASEIESASNRVIVSTTFCESSLGCKTIYHNLQNKEIKQKSRLSHNISSMSNNEVVDSDSDCFIYEDDEDYWGEEGLGHELEIDFNRNSEAINPFGKSTAGKESWKKIISRETKKRLSLGTKAMGGAILTTGGAVISGVVSAVKGNRNINEPSSNFDDRKKQELFQQSENNCNNDEAKSVETRDMIQSSTVRNIGSHLDSFNGLAGKAERRIMLAAGCSHSCMYIMDNIED